MGKGTILSGGADGLYSVSVKYGAGIRDRQISVIEAAIVEAEKQIAAATPGSIEYQIAKLVKASLGKSLVKYQNIPETKIISVWCADLTEDLTGEVGTVEVPGESVEYNIQPGYDSNAVYDPDRDGQLVQTLANTPAQAFYNLAMLPGWQKWKPTFRYATITAITSDTADVTLETTTSTQQSLVINQEETISGVAIEYMTCDGEAFTVGDSVLVKFDGQDWANPKIVGFKDNPQPCGGPMLVFGQWDTTPGFEHETYWVYDLENEQMATNIPSDDQGGIVTFPATLTELAYWYSITAESSNIQSKSTKFQHIEIPFEGTDSEVISCSNVDFYNTYTATYTESGVSNWLRETVGEWEIYQAFCYDYPGIIRLTKTETGASELDVVVVTPVDFINTRTVEQEILFKMVVPWEYISTGISEGGSERTVESINLGPAGTVYTTCDYYYERGTPSQYGTSIPRGYSSFSESSNAFFCIATMDFQKEIQEREVTCSGQGTLPPIVKTKQPWELERSIALLYNSEGTGSATLADAIPNTIIEGWFDYLMDWYKNRGYADENDSLHWHAPVYNITGVVRILL